MKAFPVFNVLETVTKAAGCKLIKFFLLTIAQIECYFPVFMILKTSFQNISKTLS